MILAISVMIKPAFDKSKSSDKEFQSQWSTALRSAQSAAWSHSGGALGLQDENARHATSWHACFVILISKYDLHRCWIDVEGLRFKPRGCRTWPGSPSASRCAAAA
jgi:hypothetical protein